MSTAPRLFVTGATGFLGGHFLFHLPERLWPVTCLVRATSKDHGTSRLLDRQRICAMGYGLPFEEERSRRMFEAVTGDIQEARCGIDVGDAPPATELWHFAAALDFEERRRDKVFTQNIEGTRHALDLARHLGARRFVYVSTAYTAGQAEGVIREELHPLDAAFNNFYEESKCHAEHEVTRFCRDEGIDHRIVRPSIVVGPSQTLRSGGTDVGIYGAVKLVHKLRELIAGREQPVTILGDPDTPLHLIPVDHFIRDCLHLVETDFAGGPIYHSTGDGSLTVDEVLNVGCERIGIGGVRVVRVREGRPSPVDRMIDRLMGIYGSYYRHPKEFVRSLPGTSRVTTRDVATYAHLFLQEHLARAPEHVFERSTIRAADGSRLNLYVGGNTDGPAVVLVNAYGMPVEFWIPIARALAGEFRVVTWDARGSPSLADEFRSDRCSVGHHADDLAVVLDASGVDAAHVVGWCTGAQVALKFGASHRRRLRSVALLSGTFSLPGEITTSQFKKNVRFVMPRIAEGMESAARYHELIYGSRQNQSYRANRGPTSPAADDAESAVVDEVLSATDELLLDMTSAPYRTPESLHRYAHMVLQLMAEPAHAWADGVDFPVLVLAGSKDEISHPDESREIARRIAGSELEIVDDATHFALYNEPRIAEALLGFLRRH